MHAVGTATKDGHGKVVKLFGTAQDVSEREQARQSLLASEERFRLVFHSTTDGILLVDAATRKLILGNKALCNLIGYTPEELTELSVADIHPPEVMPAIELAFADQAEGRRTFGEAVVVKRRDGTTFHADIAATSMVHDGRRVYVATFRDVTETRRLQASLAQSDRLASMGTLAAGVAHEINNPLSYVLYNLESLSEDIPRYVEQIATARGVLTGHLGQARLIDLLGSDSAVLDPTVFSEMQDRFKDALEGSHRIKDIARGLSTFSRVDQDKVSPVDLRYPIESAVNIAFNEIRHRAHIVKDYNTDSPVLAGEGRLAQVFLNLLINAAHAIPEGDADHNQIRVTTRQEGNEILAEVQDTGRGIPRGTLEHIFDPFFTTKPVGLGTGLGLSIAKNIVTGYGGTISATSQVGKGTRFLIRLPLAPSAGSSDVETVISNEPAVTGGGGRVLVIDDEPAIRGVLKRILRRHEVVEAESGEQGQEILSGDQRFDVILCDMMMPNVSGMDVHTWLLEHQPVLARKLVFVTGGTFTANAREYLDTVSNLRIEKPFDTTNLQKIVAERVAASRAAE